MDIKWVGIELVKPYGSNPRVIDSGAIEGVAASIRSYGWRQPIVVDQDYVILAGHVRYEAAKLLELAEVPVDVVDTMTPAEARAFRISDNRSYENSVWNWRAVSEEMKELEKSGISAGDLVVGTTFSETQMDGFLRANVVNPIEPQTEEGPARAPRFQSPSVECPHCGHKFLMDPDVLI